MNFMSTSSQYMPLTVGSLLLSVSILTGCGNSSQSSVNPPNIPSNQTIILQGAGATFPAPLYQKWISEYTAEKNKKNF